MRWSLSTMPEFEGLPPAEAEALFRRGMKRAILSPWVLLGLPPVVLGQVLAAVWIGPGPIAGGIGGGVGGGLFGVLMVWVARRKAARIREQEAERRPPGDAPG